RLELARAEPHATGPWGVALRLASPRYLGVPPSPPRPLDPGRGHRRAAVHHGRLLRPAVPACPRPRLDDGFDEATRQALDDAPPACVRGGRPRLPALHLGPEGAGDPADSVRRALRRPAHVARRLLVAQETGGAAYAPATYDDRTAVVAFSP